MTNFKKIFCTTLFSLVLIGCAGQGGINKQQIGAVTGGVAGGILGNTVFHGHGAVAGTIGTTIIGAMIGSSIGQSMDEQDKMMAQRAIINTPMGEEASWVNQKSNASYTVRPVKEYSSSGRHCRRAVTIIEINGKTDKAYTNVCKDSNGNWNVQN